MAADNTVSRSLHDLGLATWFGGSLMGAVGLNGAAADVSRSPSIACGWPPPAGTAGPGQPGRHHRPCGRRAVLLGANKGRLASQQAVARATVVKTALTGAALAATAWSRALGASRPGRRGPG